MASILVCILTINIVPINAAPTRPTTPISHSQTHKPTSQAPSSIKDKTWWTTHKQKIVAITGIIVSLCAGGGLIWWLLRQQANQKQTDIITPNSITNPIKLSEANKTDQNPHDFDSADLNLINSDTNKTRSASSRPSIDDLETINTLLADRNKPQELILPPSMYHTSASPLESRSSNGISKSTTEDLFDKTESVSLSNSNKDSDSSSSDWGSFQSARDEDDLSEVNEEHDPSICSYENDSDREENRTSEPDLFQQMMNQRRNKNNFDDVFNKFTTNCSRPENEPNSSAPDKPSSIGTPQIDFASILQRAMAKHDQSSEPSENSVHKETSSTDIQDHNTTVSEPQPENDFEKALKRFMPID